MFIIFSDMARYVDSVYIDVTSVNIYVSGVNIYGV